METPPQTYTRARIAYFALAWLFFAIGVIAAFLPLLPTTPFMLLALWAFSRSSERFHDWLYTHRLFGAPLRNWHNERVIPLYVRGTAYASMLGSLVFTAFIADFHWALPVAIAVVAIVGITFISRCPSAPSAAVKHRDSSTKTEKTAD